MTAATQPLLDFSGRPFFYCRVCGDPLSGDDILAVGLRLPEPNESVEEYCDEELVDSRELRHAHCAPATTQQAV